MIAINIETSQQFWGCQPVFNDIGSHLAAGFFSEEANYSIPAVRPVLEYRRDNLCVEQFCVNGVEVLIGSEVDQCVDFGGTGIKFLIQVFGEFVTPELVKARQV